MIPSVRRTFWSLAVTVVPDAVTLDADGWQDVEERIEAALSSRPARLRRQLRLLLTFLEWRPILRHGRRFSHLDAERRTEFLDRVQHSSALLLRRGFWGARTLVYLGYYGRPDVRRSIGYRADPRGWTAPGHGTAGGVTDSATGGGEVQR
jgi:hypothetical protein